MCRSLGVQAVVQSESDIRDGKHLLLLVIKAGRAFEFPFTGQFCPASGGSIPSFIHSFSLPSAAAVYCGFAEVRGQTKIVKEGMPCSPLTNSQSTGGDTPPTGRVTLPGRDWQVSSGRNRKSRGAPRKGSFVPEMAFEGLDRWVRSGHEEIEGNDISTRVRKQQRA